MAAFSAFRLLAREAFIHKKTCFNVRGISEVPSIALRWASEPRCTTCLKVTETRTHRNLPANGRSDSGGEREEKNKTSNFSVLFVPAILKGVFGGDESDEKSPEKDLINRIKRSIYFIQNGEKEKAEQLLHIALKMAQDLKHEKGITYVYDTMANLAYDNEEYMKAQKLFVEVLRRLISSGMPQDDIAVVNISLKTADIFAALGDYEKSEQGFLFCLDALKKKISSGVQDEDTLVLYSQTLDRYSLFLLQVGRPNEALQHIETALETAISVFGNTNNKVGAILLSDKAVIKTAAGEKEAAAQCFQEALKIADREENDTSSALIMVNYGLALKEKAIVDEAKHWCTMGLHQAFKEKNNAVKKAAEACLALNDKNGSAKGNKSHPLVL